MSKNNCGMIKDLLPLYADDVCSDESREIVAKHIEKCSECRSELEKMSRNINVSVDKDIAVIKRIKKRILIERLVAGVIAIFSIIAAVYICVVWLTSYKPMSIDEECAAQSIKIEADENGTLWLETKGYVQSYRQIIPDLIDENGNHIQDAGFDKNSKKTYCVSFVKTRADDLCDKIPVYHYIGDDYTKTVKRTRLFNINDNNQLDKIVYYNYSNKEEYVIWERDKNE